LFSKFPACQVWVFFVLFFTHHGVVGGPRFFVAVAQTRGTFPFFLFCFSPIFLRLGGAGVWAPFLCWPVPNLFCVLFPQFLGRGEGGRRIPPPGLIPGGVAPTQNPLATSSQQRLLWKKPFFFSWIFPKPPFWGTIFKKFFFPPIFPFCLSVNKTPLLQTHAPISPFKTPEVVGGGDPVNRGGTFLGGFGLSGGGASLFGCLFSFSGLFLGSPTWTPKPKKQCSRTTPPHRFPPPPLEC